MTDAYAKYERLKFQRPAERILEIVLDSPGRLNATDARMHEELAYVWRDIDADPDVSVAMIRGAGDAFSAGGDLALVEAMANDFATLTRVWREAREMVYNIINCSKPLVSAMHGPAVGAGLVCGLLADVSIAAKTARIIDGHTRLGVAAGDHAAIIWPLLCGMAKAKYYLMLCEPITGEEAERIGLVSLAVDEDELFERALEVAKRLAAGSPTAIRWTKHALNNWLRMMGPTFDNSIALEFLGFTGPDIREGLASLKEKRAPRFDPKAQV
ncbi:MAG: enoyl-CoA hydratase/isomerase family protein [Geminicoccaceae bacterium]